MSEITLRLLDRGYARDLALWQRFLARADGATVFHDPLFLAYHGGRFDERHLGYFKGETLIGLMPVALVDEQGVLTARSPYGASYGGLILDEVARYAEADRLIGMAVEHFAQCGARRIAITPPLSVYFEDRSDTLTFAMLRHGFRFANSEISSAIRLTGDVEHDQFSQSARRHARKAEKLGVSCVLRAPADDFWPLVELTHEKHGIRPTHDAAEWRQLARDLPESIWSDVAYFEGRPVAALGMMRVSARCNLAFYIAGDPAYQHLQALSLLMSRSVVEAQRSGCDWFDLGTSSIRMVPNEPVFRFKEGFGAVGVFKHTLVLDLAS